MRRTRVLTWVASLIYRVLLRCFPPDCRDDAGALSLEYQAALTRAGEQSAVALALTAGREISDVALNLVSEWVGVVNRTLTRAEGEGVMSWDGIGQDLRFAFRGLRRRMGLTLAIVVTMAIAIGGTTATFSVVDAVLLDPLPYPESDRLIFLSETFRQVQLKSLSYQNYLDWRSQNRVFEDVAARTSRIFTMTGGEEEARALQGMLLTPNATAVLGIEPTLGRMFTTSESEAKDRLVLVSDVLWRNTFGADPDVIGRSLTLDGEPYTIIGVMPPDIEFPISGADLWAPITRLSESDLSDRGSHPGIAAIGRMMPGLTAEDAKEDMDRVTAGLADTYPETNAEAGALVKPLLETSVGNSRRTLYLFMGAVGMVLLIACANVANLLLVQSSGRAREAAVRVAMGARRHRIVRLMLTESALLGLAGGAAGVLFAGWALWGIRTVQSGTLPRLEAAGLDGGVLTFAFAVSLLTALLFGLGPALHASGTHPVSALKSGGRGHSGGGRIRRALIVFEVATAFVLLVGAGLMIRTVDNLLDEDAGIATTNRLTFRTELPSVAYPTVIDRVGFYRQLVDRIRSLPGVVSVAGVDPLPLSRANRQWAISNDGFPQLDDNGLRVDVASITPDYFDTFDSPLLAGEAFDGTESVESPEVIVDEMLAETLWPEGDVLGRQIRLRGADSPWMTVIGVAPHVAHYGVQWDSRAKLYFPYSAQVSSLSFVVEVGGEPLSLVGAVREQLSQVDPDIPLTRVTTMSDLRAQTIANEALTRRVLELFGLVAITLAALGLYGVLSYSVAERTREIGIRTALGAQAQRVLAGVLGESVRLSAVGVVVGLLGALIVSRLLSSLLYGVDSFDYATLGMVGLVLSAVTLGSALLPALRAVGVDPSVALRDD